MESAAEKFIGLTCEIKSLLNDHIGIGVIGDFNDETSDMDLITHNGEFLPVLPYNQPVKIICHASKVGFRLFLGRVYLSSRELMRVIGVGTQQSVERRQYFRLNLVREAELTRILQQSTEKLDETEEPVLPEILTVEVRDVSLGGIRICTKANFEQGETFSISFTLFHQKSDMTCSVCREVFFEHQRYGDHHYGCRFIDVREKQLDKLCADLFELQRLEIRKKKEKQL